MADPQMLTSMVDTPDDGHPKPDPSITISVTSAVQDLARVIQAAAKWSSWMVWADAVGDPDEHLAHIRANLDHVERMVKEARRR